MKLETARWIVIGIQIIALVITIWILIKSGEEMDEQKYLG